MDLLKTKYPGFGPTLAHEKLVEKDKLRLSVESMCKIMIEEGLWKPCELKKIVTHQLRERRACFGELVQIDDATGRLVELLFVDSESFFSYAQATENYFKRYGKPVAPTHACLTYLTRAAVKWSDCADVGV